MTKDLVKLLLLLAMVAAVIFGVHYLGTQEDMKSKYRHPITRPGGHW